MATERHRSVVDVHLLFLDGGNVLLGRRANTGYADGMWHFPSGHLEPGESVSTAAIREAAEEVGVTISPADLEFVHVMHHMDRIGFFFVAQQWLGELHNAEPEKCTEIGWFPLDELPTDTVDYPATAVAHILRNEQFSVYGWEG
jgi:mutator protein MutT